MNKNIIYGIAVFFSIVVLGGIGLYFWSKYREASILPPGSSPVEPIPPVGFPPAPPPGEPVPPAVVTPAPVSNPDTLSTEKKYAPTSDEDLKKLFEAMRKKS